MKSELDLEVGLSPRVRGSPLDVRGGLVLGGSIPACAGEPREGASGSHPGWVYPRVCGGAVESFGVYSPEGGLSPRVRGSRLDDRGGGAPLGSIPACAGEPCRGCTSGNSAWVYPRVCGGAIVCDACEPLVVGLSPRVRGSHG